MAPAAAERPSLDVYVRAIDFFTRRGGRAVANRAGQSLRSAMSVKVGLNPLPPYSTGHHVGWTRPQNRKNRKMRAIRSQYGSSTDLSRSSDLGERPGHSLISSSRNRSRLSASLGRWAP
jgi:hypothetical protein